MMAFRFSSTKLKMHEKTNSENISMNFLPKPERWQTQLLSPYVPRKKCSTGNNKNEEPVVNLKQTFLCFVACPEYLCLFFSFLTTETHCGLIILCNLQVCLWNHIKSVPRWTPWNNCQIMTLKNAFPSIYVAPPKLMLATLFLHRL